MLVKCGSREVEFKEGDIVLDNGACYQLLTQKYHSGWHYHHHLLAKTKAKKMIKEGNLLVTKREGKMIYYRFREQN